MCCVFLLLRYPRFVAHVWYTDRTGMEKACPRGSRDYGTVRYTYGVESPPECACGVISHVSEPCRRFWCCSPRWRSSRTERKSHFDGTAKCECSPMGRWLPLHQIWFPQGLYFCRRKNPWRLCSACWLHFVRTLKDVRPRWMGSSFAIFEWINYFNRVLRIASQCSG